MRIVDEQMKDIDIQTRALDDFVTRARCQNAQHHDVHSQSLETLFKTTRAAYDRIGSQLTTTHERNASLGDDMSDKQKRLDEALATLNSTLQQPLSDLRGNISRTALQEYEPTGETPPRTQYAYPTELPRTALHENLIAAAAAGPVSPLAAASPSKSAVFSGPSPHASEENVEARLSATAGIPPRQFMQSLSGLREINVNVVGGGSRKSTPAEMGFVDLSASVGAGNGNGGPLLGRSLREPSAGRKFIKKPSVVAIEGRENAVPTGQAQAQALSRSTGWRRSPRIAQ